MGSSWARYVGSSLIAVQSGAGAGDGEGRVERETGLDGGTRLVESTKLREGGGQPKICEADNFGWPRSPVDTTRPLAPNCRGGCFATARDSHPDVSHRIARTEAQGLGNVSLCFFGATDENLAKSDSGMGVGEISIQRQRMFTFGDALRRALGEYVDKSQQHMATAHGPGPTTRLWSTSLRPPRRPPWDRSQRMCALARVRARRSNERVDIVGIGGERAIEKAARLRNIVRGQTLIEPSQTLKIEVHRVGVRRLFRASRLGGDELGVQRVRQARDDFVLHVEEIGERLIEPLGPEMIAGFGVDELDVDAHAVSAALNAALEDVADVQLAADLLQIDGLPL